MEPAAADRAAVEAATVMAAEGSVAMVAAVWAAAVRAARAGLVVAMGAALREGRWSGPQ